MDSRPNEQSPGQKSTDRDKAPAPTRAPQNLIDLGDYDDDDDMYWEPSTIMRVQTIGDKTITEYLTIYPGMPQNPPLTAWEDVIFTVTPTFTIGETATLRPLKPMQSGGGEDGNDNGGSGLPIGAIIGIVFGILALIVSLIFALIFYRRRKKEDRRGSSAIMLPQDTPKPGMSEKGVGNMGFVPIGAGRNVPGEGRELRWSHASSVSEILSLHSTISNDINSLASSFPAVPDHVPSLYGTPTASLAHIPPPLPEDPFQDDPFTTPPLSPVSPVSPISAAAIGFASRKSVVISELGQDGPVPSTSASMVSQPVSLARPDSPIFGETERPRSSVGNVDIPGLSKSNR